YVFFDKEWNSLLNMKSFGHDIEAAWLMDETIKVLDRHDEAYTKMVVDIAYNIADYAMQDDGSLVNEELNGVADPTRIWGVQAEAIVGFYNAYERTGDERFIELVHGVWEYTKKFINDDRAHHARNWTVDE